MTLTWLKCNEEKNDALNSGVIMIYTITKSCVFSHFSLRVCLRTYM